MQWHDIGQHLPDEERDDPEAIADLLAFAEDNRYLHIGIDTVYREGHGKPLDSASPGTHLEEAAPGEDRPYTEVTLRSGSHAHTVRYDFFDGTDTSTDSEYLHEDLRPYRLAAELEDRIDRVIISSREP